MARASSSYPGPGWGGLNTCGIVRMRTAALVLPVALALTAGAQPASLSGLDQVLPERTGPRGQVLPWSTTPRVQPRQAALTPALQRAWERQLQAVAAALRRAPVLATPRGFHLQLQGTLEVVPEGPAPRALLAGTVRLRALGLQEVQRGRGGALQPRAGAAPEALELSLNEPADPAAFAGLPWMRDAKGAFFALRAQARVQGFPVLGGELWVYPEAAPPFRPVSRGRLIAAFLEANPHPAGSTARLAARYAALRDAVSTEALEGPAWLSDDPLEPALVQPDAPGARPVLELAPGFLQAGPARTQVRLVRVKGLEAAARAGALPADSPQRVYLEVLQQVDWKALVTALAAR